jgi:7-carboxy-7-deazaguanine synthase
MALKVHEIFYSLQGESSRVGLPTVFIRLTGCPLRCGYCDTEYAFTGGQMHAIDSLLESVRAYSTRYVCVTGGEPLAQKECPALLTALCNAGYSVSLETSGAIDIAPVDDRVSVIMDIKTPGSGEVDKNRWENLALLRQKDEVKFVLAHQTDYVWAKSILQQHHLADICPVLFSPVYERLMPADLAAWILQDNLSVRMQVQLHKLLWGEKPGV